MTDASPDAIRTQLDRILADSAFSTSNRLSQFLRYIVETTMDGRPECIKQYTIAVEAMGFDAEFDPRSNPLVRIHARQLRHALNEYYLTHGDDPVRIVLRKGTYIPKFIVNNAEIPPASNPRSEILNDMESDLPLRDMSVAVLPFRDQIQDDNNAYIASGLTQSFVVALSRFTDFEVIGPLSKLDVDQIDLRTIGREYGVRFVLHGTVRKLEQLIRISVMLNETERSLSMWAENYDYDLASLPLQAIEDDVIGRIAATIADNSGVMPRRLLDTEKNGTRTRSLVDRAILRYYHATSYPTPEATNQALEALSEANRNYPTHITVLAMLADMSAQAFPLGILEDTVLEKAEEMARRAIALNPNHQLSHWVLAWVSFLRFKAETCIRELDIALSLNSNYAIILFASAYMLSMIGEMDRAMSLMKRALHLNPHYPGYSRLVFFIYHYRRKEYEEALSEAMLINTPGFYGDPLCRASAF